MLHSTACWSLRYASEVSKKALDLVLVLTSELDPAQHDPTRKLTFVELAKQSSFRCAITVGRIALSLAVRVRARMSNISTERLSHELSPGFEPAQR